ncbi:hypothetical protein Glove_326g169 [Diversispora epigaea]|uniref:Uncharacterized protein n=1 Tax=Diversispora epigaea TaxID=1348612 RepID=A0A397HQ30_9GLOM|nr:hypothetical protein Glove_326g169 [Diversispora epigaea]
MGITRDDDQTLALSSSSSSPRPITSDSNNNPFFSQEDPDVYCSGDQLVYYGQIFKKGDLVLVSDSTSGRYTAKFLTTFDTEAVIQRPDGSRTKLQLNLLKEGKYQIQLKET